MRVPLIQNRTVHGSLPNGTIVDKWVLTKTQTNPHDSFFYIEAVCNAWFTIEIIMRFSSAPNKGWQTLLCLFELKLGSN